MAICLHGFRSVPSISVPSELALVSATRRDPSPQLGIFLQILVAAIFTVFPRSHSSQYDAAHSLLGNDQLLRSVLDTYVRRERGICSLATGDSRNRADGRQLFRGICSREKVLGCPHSCHLSRRRNVWVPAIRSGATALGVNSGGNGWNRSAKRNASLLWSPPAPSIRANQRPPVSASWA